MGPQGRRSPRPRAGWPVSVGPRSGSVATGRRYGPGFDPHPGVLGDHQGLPPGLPALPGLGRGQCSSRGALHRGGGPADRGPHRLRPPPTGARPDGRRPAHASGPVRPGRAGPPGGDPAGARPERHAPPRRRGDPAGQGPRGDERVAQPRRGAPGDPRGHPGGPRPPPLHPRGPPPARRGGVHGPGEHHGDAGQRGGATRHRPPRGLARCPRLGGVLPGAGGKGNGGRGHHARGARGRGPLPV